MMFPPILQAARGSPWIPIPGGISYDGDVTIDGDLTVTDAIITDSDTENETIFLNTRDVFQSYTYIKGMGATAGPGLAVTFPAGTYNTYYANVNGRRVIPDAQVVTVPANSCGAIFLSEAGVYSYVLNNSGVCADAGFGSIPAGTIPIVRVQTNASAVTNLYAEVPYIQPPVYVTDRGVFTDSGKQYGAEWNFDSSGSSQYKSFIQSLFYSGLTNKYTAKMAYNGMMVGLDVGSLSPTAYLHLQAGAAAAGSAPLKLTAGTNLTSVENGAVEFNGTHLYITIGGVRYQLDQQGGGGATVGFVYDWGGSIANIPAGFLLCDGSAVSRTTYAALFAAIGITHGAGNGTTTFNLPPRTNRFPIGAYADVTGTPVTNIMGSNLATGGVTCHDHCICDPGHQHAYSGSTSGHQHAYSGSTDSHSHSYSGTTSGHPHTYSGNTGSPNTYICADSITNNILVTYDHTHTYSGTTDNATDSYGGNTDSTSVNYSGNTNSATDSYGGNTDTVNTGVYALPATHVPPFAAAVYIIKY